MPFTACCSAGRAFAGDQRGNVALLLGLLSPLLLGLVGGSVDLFVYRHHRAELQSTADAAVLAAAAEAGLKGWTQKSAGEIAASVIDSNLTNKFSSAKFDFQVKVDELQRRIAINLTQDHYGYFLIGYFAGSPQITVQSVARATGQAKICIIVQSADASEAFAISGKSRVRASGCSSYSNSIKPKGMSVKDTSNLTTQLACSAGGYAGKPGAFSPLPITDCPALSDPLSARGALIANSINASHCDFNETKLKAAERTLSPGNYCRGLEITDGSVVNLQPGVYVILNGKLKVDKGSTIKGSGVGFVFIGDKSSLEFKNDSIVSLSAPEGGLMAGLLMFAQSGKKSRDFKIESEDAQTLIGTVYLPKERLIVGGDEDGDGICDPDIADDGTVTPAGPGEACVADVGAASAWTAIVVDQLRVTAGSSLVLNSDYSATDIPVPQGLGPNSSRVILAQ